MLDYQIVTDSSADLPKEILEEYGIISVPLTVEMEGEEPKSDHEIDAKAFYASLRAGKKAITSAINIGTFQDVFSSLCQKGKDILYIGFSSGLSATYYAGETAMKGLRDQFPDRTLLSVDSLAASLGQGLLVYLAAQKKAAGTNILDLRAYLEATKLHLCHWFTVEDLFFLKRGGRISAATAILGSMLAFKPILHVDNEGHLINVSKVRGRKESLRELCRRMEASALSPSEQTVFISHGDCPEDAEYLAQLIREAFHPQKILIAPIGPVIGAHSGPGTMALFFIGEER